ncbi:porin [Mesosutterella sp. OilRF-GAM-744-9]|uniref:Porin n=1 Tax=Mesosutterella porci TaxID=2915351 RepID=A0ABS9MPY9_9BURK|nr:porin [Mesosutterella sp. oilRF-744-WT-GAM-9]MCG5030671.1 porin [Mesosutterella sp. oilRF-744-WT-GAM-9]
MMKKSLVAVAILGAFAASAFAAPSVTLYGRIDTGLVYTHQDLDKKGVDSTDTFEMKSGFTTGSRWGLKGTEDIGNAKVGFVLESGFTSDDGVSTQGSRLFGREAQVNVSGAYGTLYAGRLMSIAGIGGSVSMLGGVSAFGMTYGDTAKGNGSTGSAYTRYDNTLAYMTPKFGGFRAGAMYSFKGDSQKEKDANENTAGATRYAALGLQYKAPKYEVVLVGDYTMWGNQYDSKTGKKGYHVDDGYSIILGGNYDFGPAKVFAKATYFDNEDVGSVVDSFKLLKNVTHKVENKDKNTTAVKGWGLELGTKVPAFGGNFLAAVGYRDAKDIDDSDVKFHRWNVAAGYTYAFSKRTSVYGLVGYAQEKAKGASYAKANSNPNPNEVQAGFGLVHKF